MVLCPSTNSLLAGRQRLHPEITLAVFGPWRARYLRGGVHQLIFNSLPSPSHPQSPTLPPKLQPHHSQLRCSVGTSFIRSNLLSSFVCPLTHPLIIIHPNGSVCYAITSFGRHALSPRIPYSSLAVAPIDPPRGRSRT